jgi:hypothetical protein
MLHRGLLGQVVNLRACSSLGLLGVIASSLKQLPNWPVRLIQIAENADLRWASLNTCWQLASIYTVGAEVAFLDHTFVLAEKACVIRTSDDAVTATHAF